MTHPMQTLQNTYYLVRHAEARSNQENILATSIERSVLAPLTSRGVSQVEALCQSLPAGSIDRVVSSDLLRAQQTAERVAECQGAQLTYDARLRDRFAGIFDGGPIEEMRRAVQDDLQWNTVGYEMESYQAVYERMKSVVQELEQSYSGMHIMLVSHCSPLRILLAWVHGLQGAQLSPKSPEMASMTEVHHADPIIISSGRHVHLTLPIDN